MNVIFLSINCRKQLLTHVTQIHPVIRRIRNSKPLSQLIRIFAMISTSSIRCLSSFNITFSHTPLERFVCHQVPYKDDISRPGRRKAKYDFSLFILDEHKVNTRLSVRKIKQWIMIYYMQDIQ